jgi:hypothetical protein
MTGGTERGAPDGRGSAPSDPAHDRKKFPEIRGRCSALLDRLADRLPPDQIEQYRKFNFFGEYLEVADNLAATLLRGKIPVTAGERDALREILYSLGRFPPSYRYIATRDEVLASLTIAGTQSRQE